MHNKDIVTILFMLICTQNSIPLLLKYLSNLREKFRKISGNLEKISEKIRKF